MFLPIHLIGDKGGNGVAIYFAPAPVPYLDLVYFQQEWGQNKMWQQEG